MIAAARRAPSNGSAPTAGARGLRATIERRLKEAGESAFAAFVRKRSDAQLERTLGSGPGLRIMFKGMERAFVPEKAAGFTGEIQYELTGARNGIGEWVVRVDGGQRRRSRPAARRSRWSRSGCRCRSSRASPRRRSIPRRR